MIKLNLGCSNDIKQGYVNIDLYHKDSRVTIADVRKLDFLSNNSVIEIIAHDILEHLAFNESLIAIKEWSRILASGGIISIKTTNLTEHIKAFNNNKWNLEKINYMMFAGIGWTDGVSRDQDWHKSIYTIEFLTEQLKKNNISIISTNFDSHENTSTGNLNLHILGKKI
jgi:hypothetical protein